LLVGFAEGLLVETGLAVGLRVSCAAVETGFTEGFDEGLLVILDVDPGYKHTSTWLIPLLSGVRNPCAAEIILPTGYEYKLPPGPAFMYTAAMKKLGVFTVSEIPVSSMPFQFVTVAVMETGDPEITQVPVVVPTVGTNASFLPPTRHKNPAVLGQPFRCMSFVS